MDTYTFRNHSNSVKVKSGRVDVMEIESVTHYDTDLCIYISTCTAFSADPISAYGETRALAIDELKSIVQDNLQYLFEEGYLTEELLSLGWVME